MSMKKLIKHWLGINKLESAIVKRDNYIKFLQDTLQIGVDLHFKKECGKSWAVVCLNGKADYVNFFYLPDEDIRRIAYLLKEFKRDNVTVDYLPGTKKMIFDII